jgi:Tfp pilus assembly protein PilZ
VPEANLGEAAMDMFAVGFGGVICILTVLVVWLINSFVRARLSPDRAEHPLLKASRTVWEEKRQYRRAEIRWPIKIKTAEGLIEAETKDVSLGGTFVSCAQPRPLGEIFPVTILAPNHEPVMVNAEVVWSNGNVPDDKVVTRGMGIRFVQVTGDIRHFLEEAIEAHVDGSVAAIDVSERSWEEKRQHARAEIKWPVKVGTAQGLVDAETRDISVGGAFISCPEPLPLGHNFPLTISAPDHEPQRVTAEVVWSNSNVPDDKILNRGMGVRFIQISDEARQFLNEAISAHFEKCERDRPKAWAPRPA